MAVRAQFTALGEQLEAIFLAQLGSERVNGDDERAAVGFELWEEEAWFIGVGVGGGEISDADDNDESIVEQWGSTEEMWLFGGKLSVKSVSSSLVLIIISHRFTPGKAVVVHAINKSKKLLQLPEKRR